MTAIVQFSCASPCSGSVLQSLCSSVILSEVKDLAYLTENDSVIGKKSRSRARCFTPLRFVQHDNIVD